MSNGIKLEFNSRKSSMRNELQIIDNYSNAPRMFHLKSILNVLKSKICKNNKLGHRKHARSLYPQTLICMDLSPFHAMCHVLLVLTTDLFTEMAWIHGSMIKCQSFISHKPIQYMYIFHKYKSEASGLPTNRGTK